MMRGKSAPVSTNQPQAVSVAAKRQPPRIAGGIVVLVLSRLVGLIILAMGQSVLGPIWRAWIVNILIIVAVRYFLM
jgi:hypothetical protein